MTYQEFYNLPDAQEDRSKSIDLDFVIMRQLDTIRNIASREFHKGIILYGESGLARTYLPDVLESYKKAINNLVDLLSIYDNKNVLIKPEKENYENYRKVLRSCLNLLKSLGILPDEKGLFEIIKPPKKRN